MVTTAQSPCVGQVGVVGNTPPSSPSHLLLCKLDATQLQSPFKQQQFRSGTQHTRTTTNILPPVLRLRKQLLMDPWHGGIQVTVPHLP